LRLFTKYVIKQAPTKYVFDSPKTRLFIHAKDKLAKYMVCVTIFFKVRDHYFFRN